MGKLLSQPRIAESGCRPPTPEAGSCRRVLLPRDIMEWLRVLIPSSSPTEQSMPDLRMEDCSTPKTMAITSLSWGILRETIQGETSGPWPRLLRAPWRDISWFRLEMSVPRTKQEPECGVTGRKPRRMDTGYFAETISSPDRWRSTLPASW